MATAGIGIEVLPYLVVSVPVLLLAAWIAYIRFDDPLHRTFALFLFLRGVILILFVWDAKFASLPSRVAAYLNLALPFVLLWFMHLARLRYASSTSGRAVRPDARVWYGVLGCGVLVEALYLANHGFYVAAGRAGILYLLQEARLPLLALVAFVLARDHRRASSGAARSALFLLSLGLALEPLYAATFFLAESAVEAVRISSFSAFHWDRPGAAVLDGFHVLSLALAAATLVILRPKRGENAAGGARPLFRRYLLAAGLAFGTGLAIAVWFQWATSGAAELGLPVRDYPPSLAALATLRLFNAVWLTALPAGLFIGYAFSKHRLFDLPQRARWTIEKGTLAGLFVALAFVGTEAAQYSLSRFFGENGSAGAIVGVLGAGAIMFLLTPLHRWAERVSRSALPDAKPVKEMTGTERAAVYREQVELAWLDGVLQRKERLLLDALRVRLGIDEAVAARIESEAVAKAVRGPGAAARRGATGP
ncbi:MAG: hypothetical protein HYT80_03405 [Euryarchaeota archaeon]|nr:hypothetical protein [Euryarchaeota archaeon]